MKILVLGSAGYIGSYICKALAALGYVTVVFDNVSVGHDHAVRCGQRVKCDINNLIVALAGHQHGAVMHFAAKIEVDEGQRRALDFWENSVAGVITLLQAMDRACVRPIVISSMCAVYGELQGIPITEAERCEPVSVYRRTKRAAAFPLADAARVGGERYAALRYFNAAGAGPDAKIGEEHDPETLSRTHSRLRPMQAKPWTCLAPITIRARAPASATTFMSWILRTHTWPLWIG